MAVQRSFTDIELGRQGGSGNPLGTGLLQHGSQGLQDLDPALAGFGTLANRGVSLTVLG
jgi:hypothetical protein